MRKLAAPAALAVAVIALTVPATATAKNIKQNGFVVGDKAATVKLRVQVKGGDPVKVAGFRAKNVVARCGKETIRIQLTALSPVSVQEDGDFKVRLSDGEGGILRISGSVSDDGRSTAGNVKTNEFDQGDGTCKVPKQKFTTSA
ncbi:MAG: hypothetical protein U0R24_07760 [Solirubrobacterales bacterium]